MSTRRMTMAQALVEYLAVQRVERAQGPKPLVASVFAIFGHGNVAGLGHALEESRKIPTLRAHNEQAMAHAAIAFAKANRRRQVMACTTSIGPGATNLVTAAAVAHTNRLPVLLLPGDVFAGRAPDPVLQQLEDFSNPGVTANDCLRPVSAYFDRINRPEQLLTSLPQAVLTLLDPVRAGPVTLALPQDVQTEAFDYPEAFFYPTVRKIRRPRPDRDELLAALEALRKSKRPMILAGGGVLYSGAEQRLAEFCEAHQIPVAETQAGKGALRHDHPMNVGGLGVTGSGAANQLLEAADLVLAIGTRLSDFTTASATLFPRLGKAGRALIMMNVAAPDAIKYSAHSMICDAEEGLISLAEGFPMARPNSSKGLESSETPAGRSTGRSVAWSKDPIQSDDPPQRSSSDRPPGPSQDWARTVADAKVHWDELAVAMTKPFEGTPTDAQVLGVVNRFATDQSTVVCAAGGLPGELHKLWKAAGPLSYHVEYGYSCMGYEIAGGLGVKMAHPDREVIVMVGDGSYLMLNSEIATSVALGHKLLIVLLDNRGFGCINRLQRATGGAPFNNLLGDAPKIDFVMHARALGAMATKVDNLEALNAALTEARGGDKTWVLVIETDPERGSSEGGAWWDVPMSEVTGQDRTKSVRADYENHLKKRQGD